MIILTPLTVAGLVGRMYVLLSLENDKSLSYINGYMDTIFHYENALKMMLLFEPDLKEVPIRRKLFSLKEKEYSTKIMNKKEKDYSDGAVDANNNLYYHVQQCYRG